jgi:hypothetical protein
MTKINILKCCFLFVLIGCANTYNLEENSILSFSESYYKFSSTGVRGGNSGYEVYLKVDKKSGLDKKKAKLQGIYFKEKYVALKYQESNTYQGYIIEKSTADKLEFDNIKEHSTTKEEALVEKIPFLLKDNEAVIKYSINRKLKYVKIILTKKKVNFFPM